METKEAEVINTEYFTDLLMVARALGQSSETELKSPKSRS